MHKNITKIIGNILIGISLLGFGVTLFPLLQMYYFPKKVDASLIASGEYIVIPEINATAKIIENVDPWNEYVYKKALTQGVAHAKQSALPGEKGTTFLFAHSSGLPWEITNNNTPFLRLNELEKGDEIVITKNQKHYNYVVTDKKEIYPNEVEYLTKKTKDNLILQTCTPIGTSLRRLLIFAKLQAA